VMPGALFWDADGLLFAVHFARKRNHTASDVAWIPRVIARHLEVER